MAYNFLQIIRGQQRTRRVRELFDSEYRDKQLEAPDKGSGRKVSLPPCGRQNNDSPSPTHVLLPRICDTVTGQGKGDVSVQMKLRLLISSL